jgi:hypothetical protein
MSAMAVLVDIYHNLSMENCLETYPWYTLNR